GNSDPMAFGRVARLTLTPTFTTSVLALEKPPNYTDEPADKGAVAGFQQRIFEFLAMEAKGAWRTRTQVFSACGNKNGSTAAKAALSGLVEDGVVEELITAANGGKGLDIRTYRVPVEESNPS